MRTSRGLPFNACVNARACTSILGKPAHLNLNHELHQGVARLGLLTLPTAGEREQVGTLGAQAKNVTMHLCVCLITLI